MKYETENIDFSSKYCFMSADREKCCKRRM